MIRLVGSGEPTLYPYFSELVNAFKDNGHKLKLITNGQQLSRLKDIVAKNIDSIIISVHGNEETHDKLTDKSGSYKNVFQGIFDLREISPHKDLTLHFVITPDNYEQIYEHVQMSKALNTKARFQHLVFTDANVKLGTFDINKLKYDISKIRLQNPEIRFVPDLSNKQIDEYYDTSKSYIRQPHQCKRILTDLSVRYDGKVIMCDNRLLGNITNESVIEILKGKLRSEFLKNRTNEAASEKGLPDTCSRCCYN
jgi:radical SAM protein with 4Fe4S-binding SPASM domain